VSHEQERREAVAAGQKQHSYIAFVNLLSEADLKDGEVFRWWAVQMMLAIHGDLDSIAYSLRKLVEQQQQRAQPAPPRPTPDVELPPRRRARADNGRPTPRRR